MVRVTPTQPHVRRSSYHFYQETWSKHVPIFVRRTAINQPPTQHPQSKEVRWLRDRFRWANHVWSTFTSDQRSFYRNIAIEVTTSMGGGRVEIKLLSGQELFVAMMMKIKSYGQYKALVPQRWELFALDLCGNVWEDTRVTLYSKSLKRTIVNQQGDQDGLFQWISVPPWAAPFRLTITTKCLGEISQQFNTLDDLLHATLDAILHPVKIYSADVGWWTLATDPIWCVKRCSESIYSQYGFNSRHQYPEAIDGQFRKPLVHVMPLSECRFRIRTASLWSFHQNQLWWKNTFIKDIDEFWWLVWSRWITIDGETGEILD